MAFAGLTLLLVCMFFPVIFLKDTWKHANQTLATSQELTVDEKLWDRSASLIENALNKQDKLTKDLEDRIQVLEKQIADGALDRDAVNLARQQLNDLRAELEKTRQQSNASAAALADLEKRRIEIAKQSRELDHEMKDFNYYWSLCNFGYWIGVVLLVVGGNLWYLKLQRHQDRIVENEARASQKSVPRTRRNSSKRPKLGRLLKSPAARASRTV
jgi:hypothetical protein